MGGVRETLKMCDLRKMAIIMWEEEQKDSKMWKVGYIP
jgi:hypothetical protein